MRLAAALPVLLLAGCGRCGPSTPETDAAPQPPEPPPPLLPTARPWSFQAVRGRPAVAVPEGCRLRAPVMRAEVPPKTGFYTEPRSLAAVIVADASEDGAQLLASGMMRFDDAGALIEQRAVPWRAPDAAPRLSKLPGGGLLAAVTERDEARDSRALLWRDGAVARIGEGDRFEVVDLWCERDRCALLTSRLGRVAMPGAEVRMGNATAPLSTWTALVIEPQEADGDAHPLGIVRWPEPPGDGAPEVAVLADAACALFAFAPEGPRELGRIPAPHGVLDILGIPAPTAMLHGAPVDDDGCMADSPSGRASRVRFAQVGREEVEIATPAPPLRGALRRLARGALATWIAPLGCGIARKVVYAVRLDEAGRPLGTVIPVADAERYGVASEGAEVDLWLQHADAVTWMRLRCDG